MRFCNKCGKPVSEGIKFCTNCGNPISDANVNPNRSEDNKKEDLGRTISSTNEAKSESSNADKKQINMDIKNENNYMGISELEKNIINNSENNFVKEKEKESNEQTDKYNSKQETYYQPINKLDNTKNDFNKANKSILSGVLPKVIIGIVLVIAILGGIFFNRIRGEYYIFKANNAITSKEKLEYAIDAISVLKSNTTRDLLKNILVEMAKSDVDLAETKLNELSGMLSQGEFQNISIDIKQKKIDKLYSERKYQEALSEFGEIDKLGGNFKENKNYDDIMLNVISKLTGEQIQSTKDLLMENKNVCYDNFDGDPFDEIIELKANDSYNTTLKLNMYKFKNGQYRLTDSKSFQRTFREKLQGVYNYDTDKKGIFICYANGLNNIQTSVFGISNEKLQLKGVVSANEETMPDDVDNDGIYEVLSKSISMVVSNKKETSKWYKIYDDGRTPTEVTINGQKSNDVSGKSSDYIFNDSDKAYLTEEDVRYVSKERLALARNEIFARHGYVFNDEQYKKYFSEKSWYVPNPSYDGNDSALNEYESANYKTIQSWEKR